MGEFKPRIVAFPRVRRTKRERERERWEAEIENRLAQLEKELNDPLCLLRRLVVLAGVGTIRQ